MRKFLKSNILFIIIISFVVALIFWQFFIKHLIISPGDYMLAWYEPWKTDHMINGKIIIPHKPIASDVFRQFYPFKILAVDMIKHFRLPLWNPYNGAGMPLLATINIGLLDPFNSLFFLLPYPAAWSTYIILQGFLIALFMYLYCEKIGLKKTTSLLCSFIFLFSGAISVRLIYSIFGLAFAMLPFGLYCIESYVQNKKTKKIFFLPLIACLITITTLPQVALSILTFFLVYLFVRVRHVNKIFFILTLLLLGFGIAAIQLLPTLELFFNANMTSQASRFIFDRFLLSPLHFLTILIPNYFGSDATYNYWGTSDYVETAVYLGLIPSFLAFVSVFVKFDSDKRNLKYLFIYTIGITLFLTMASPITKFLFSLPIPIISTSIPSRIYFLTTFSLSILAGFGFEALSASKKLTKILLSFFSALAGTIVLTAFALYKLHIACNNTIIIQCRLVALHNTLLETGVFALFASTLLTYLFSKQKFIQQIFVTISILLVIIEGLYNLQKYLPFTQATHIMPVNNLIHELQTNTRNGRVFGEGKANIATDFATYYRFFDPNYYHPLYIKRYGELVAYSNIGNTDSPLLRSDVEIANNINLKTETDDARRQRLFDLLGISYLIFSKDEQKPNQPPVWQDQHWFIEKNSSALPRAYIVDSYQLASQNNILKKLFDTNFNPASSVILEKNPNGITTSNEKLISSVSSLVFKENSVKLTATSNKNALLVLSDNYYPGWKAYIDNKQTKILRANYTFRAIVLPKGKHIILFRYEPLSVTVGVWISIFSFIIFLLLLLRNVLARSKQS